MNTTALCPVDAFLLIGPTGSGKSPLGAQIASRGLFGKQSHHLDFGAELRSITSGRDSSFYTSAEHDFIVGVLERGLLLENEHFLLAKKILLRFLDRTHFRSSDLLILNGIPRHYGQACDISSFASIHGLIVLDCSVASVYIRIVENTAGDRTGRSDDAFNLIENKLSVFNSRTEPLIDYYSRSGAKIYRLSVNEKSTTEAVYLQLTSLASTYPPVTLITKPPQR